MQRDVNPPRSLVEALHAIRPWLVWTWAVAAIACVVASPTTAAACDICAVYTSTEILEGQAGVRLGIAEQYTDFNTVQDNSVEIPNPLDQYIHSSITQIVGGYQFNRWIGVQANLPVIYRSWQRPVGEDEIQNSSRGGIGDISIIANVLAFDTMGDNGVFRFTLLGGLKLPSGDAGFLKEELDEGADGHDDHDHDEHDAAQLARTSQGGHEHAGGSAVHGHDLAFGSGSVDGIVGAQIFHSYRRFFWTAALQYKITTEGSYEYQYANDLTWLGGPGLYVLLDDAYTLRAQAVFSGETKGEDTQQGRALDDSSVTNLFVGPGIDFTWGSRLTAEIDVDLPVVQNNSGVQIVADYRLRGALVWHF